MDQAGIIRDLLSWLDSHLDQPLSLDNVAAKAGYSKWHLQRMFKEVTGHAIGAYIRARRLSKAAVALRLTSRPILDIALQYRFDSQQTFTRAFKKQFAQTPALYRRKEEWDSTGIRPPIRLNQSAMPQAEFIRLPAMELIGVTQSYTCTLEQLSSFRTELRIHFWRQYLGEAKCLPPTLYGLNHTRPSLEKEDEQEVLYTTAIEPQHMPENVHGGEPVHLDGGNTPALFIKARPTTCRTSFCRCTAPACRRKAWCAARDAISNDSSPERKPDAELPHTMRCEYLIPVRR
ncbi:Right origin-binding protein [Sodalis praecaptivus]